MDLGGCMTGDALGFILLGFIFPKPWNTDGCCVMMWTMEGLTDFFSSVTSSVDAISALIAFFFNSILGVLKVIIPSDPARLLDTKLIDFPDRSSSSTTIHVDSFFSVFPVNICCEFIFRGDQSTAVWLELDARFSLIL